MSERPEQWKAAPYFIVPDIKQATDYYQNQLGFTVDDWGTFAMVNRGGVTIMLSELAMGKQYPELINPNRKKDHHAWDVYIWINKQDLKLLHEEFMSNEVNITSEPTERPMYGMMELEVTDPFGYVLCFGQDLEQE